MVGHHQGLSLALAFEQLVVRLKELLLQIPSSWWVSDCSKDVKVNGRMCLESVGFVWWPFLSGPNEGFPCRWCPVVCCVHIVMTVALG